MDHRLTYERNAVVKVIASAYFERHETHAYTMHFLHVLYASFEIFSRN